MSPVVRIVALFCGGIFGYGLALSTMVRPEVVLSFLQLDDLGLLLVLGGALAVTMLTYQIAPRLRRSPLFGEVFDRRHGALERRTVIGAVIFGAGWGLCGVCPGPAIAGLGVGNWPLAVALAGIFAGAWAHGRIESE
jgi:uncharacterized membrane protein YedE/YeeE